MRFVLPLLLVLAACGSGAPDRPSPRALPDGRVIVQAQEFPEEITGLLTEAEADSCGVCIREKRADAFEIAGDWFAPGFRVDAGSSEGWRVLPGGEMELWFGDAEAQAPRLTFRFHTDDDHLVGIASADFTDPDLAARILARPAGAPGREVLEVVHFEYGDGETFIFDEAQNRIQVQCRVLEETSGSAQPAPYGGTLRQDDRR